MNKIKTICVAVLSAISSTAWAGGFLTNTNQNIAFLRNPARDGVIAIDGVYSNPAGVAFLGKGLFLSFNNQSAFQTRTIRSGIAVPAFQGTPFYQPFKLNGGDENGIKEFKGEASAPIIPSVQAALNYDKWGFQASFAVVGGGGKATFNRGLGSFERQIALIPAVLYQINNTYKQQYGLDLGLGSNTPSYSVKSYIHGQQYVFGLQLGTTYKVNEHLAVYGGFRFNYVYNRYEGSITDISANINGRNENLYSFFQAKALALMEQSGHLQQQSLTYAQMAEQAKATQPEAAAQYEAAAAQCAQGAALAKKGAEQMEASKKDFADRYLDCTQRGWAITPIIGVDYKWNRLNIGARLEFTTHFNIQNDTKRDDTGLFANGVNTPGDMPGIFTVGGQYEVVPSLRVMAGYHYFFDKNARMDKDKQKLLTGNTQEYNAGVEYDINDAIMVSVGMQRTQYGLGDGSFLNDMSFVSSSCSFGFGASVKVSRKVRLNAGYFWTNYETFDKKYTQELGVGDTKIQVNNTDSFTRTNKVYGMGVDIAL
ncbi:MAG: hypothetical protein PUH24_09550 [Prevotellaceae bacterium]|nr:hypothetical protein [Prevotella sp.]MDD7258491.1 hypothetical protein [Prevotellaceae bacterium]MDY6130257.1 hypothetical protein [Prevotella sp.]